MEVTAAPKVTNEKSLRMFKRKKIIVGQIIVEPHVTQGINFCQTSSHLKLCNLSHKAEKNGIDACVSNIQKSYFIKWIFELKLVSVKTNDQLHLLPSLFWKSD